LEGVADSFMLALLPVLLIALAVIANTFFPGGSIIKKIVLFTGDATIALLISVIAAVLILGIMRGKKMQQVMQWLNDSIMGVAVILLIITAGGVFKQVLIDSGTANYITSFSKEMNIHPLLFTWLVTALLRVAIGSATVAGITAAGIVSPLLATGTVSPELLVLAVGTGSVFGSHVNDSGFWIFKEFFNLSLKQTFLSWTVMETLISVLGLIGVMVLDLFI
jgi:H+/gluconate symporter-like permease